MTTIWVGRDRRLCTCRADRAEQRASTEIWSFDVARHRTSATTGGKPKLRGIRKRGNKYLRKQLIYEDALRYLCD